MKIKCKYKVTLMRPEFIAFNSMFMLKPNKEHLENSEKRSFKVLYNQRLMNKY